MQSIPTLLRRARERTQQNRALTMVPLSSRLRDRSRGGAAPQIAQPSLFPSRARLIVGGRAWILAAGSPGRGRSVRRSFLFRDRTWVTRRRLAAGFSARPPSPSRETTTRPSNEIRTTSPTTIDRPCA